MGKINIISKHHKEFETKIDSGGQELIIQTEALGEGIHEVVTSIYKDGAIIRTIRSDYAPIIGQRDFSERLLSLMRNQHRAAIEEFKGKHPSPDHYKGELRELVKKKNFKSAFLLSVEAMNTYPEEPSISSYHGFLLCKVEKKYKEGLDLCQKSIKRIGEFKDILPLLYLNLGRAYLASGDKKRAIEAFQRGLKYDKNNHDLKWEIKKLGVRKNPVIPFLDRKNPINKYLGKLRARLFD